MKMTQLPVVAILLTVCFSSESHAYPQPTHVWSHQYGDASEQAPRAMLLDGNGNPVVFGNFYGTVNFGNGAMTSAGQSDGFVAKFDASGNAVWTKQIGGAGIDWVQGGAIDASQNVIVVGSLNNKAVIRKYSPDGTLQWAVPYDVNGAQYGFSATTDAAGNVYVGGTFVGELSLGGPTRSTNGSEMFLVKFTSAGTFVWSKQYGNETTCTPRALDTDSYGNLVIACEPFGTVNFGGGALTGIQDGSTDIVLAKLRPNGDYLWAKRFAAAGYDVVGGMELGPDNHIYVGGTVHHDIALGGDTLDVFEGFGNPDGIVAVYGPNGTHIWSQNFGNDQPQSVTSLALEPNGDIVIAGQVWGMFDFFGLAISATPAGQEDMLIARINGQNRKTLWYAQADGTSPPGCFIDVADNVLVAAIWLFGSSNFGGGPVTTAGSTDIVLASYTEPSPTTAVRPLAADATLEQNVPNPFNPSTVIPFSVARDARVAVAIYDVAGKQVRTISAGRVPAGSHRVQWDGLDNSGRPVASGVYVYRLEGAPGAAARKMLLIK